MTLNFNPRHREGDDRIPLTKQMESDYISIHVTAKVTTRDRIPLAGDYNFNPRHREGDDAMMTRMKSHQNGFQSTSPRR